MPNANPSHLDLQATAKEIMRLHGFQPDFPPTVLQQLTDLRAHPPQIASGKDVRDLRNLLWSSIDNDTSRDLDQIEVAERLPNGDMKVLVGIADVDAFVPKQTAIDQHAARETTTVYAGVRNFPMLPEELSTGKTSLLENQDCLSVVIEFVADAGGHVTSSDVYRALARNRAQLQYNSVGAWLEGTATAPAKVAASTDLQAQLRLQNEIAQKLKNQRFANGALNLQTDELRPLILNDQVVDMEKQQKNHATELIEDFMIAANGVTARYLASKKFPSLRRVVRTPKRWDRIVELAAERGSTLPKEPDAKALEQFLVSAKAADPLRFPDLSLSVVKLLGAGEYVVELPGDSVAGHFGLAVEDYAHSTAPNRRYPDVITQRLLKAAVAGQSVPYENNELEALATHCTEEEDAAKKVERQVTKSAAAMLLESRIGEQFDAIVTGASNKGTWVRILRPPVEGRLDSGFENMRVGDRLRVQLASTDVERGYIDFKKVV